MIIQDVTDPLNVQTLKEYNTNNLKSAHSIEPYSLETGTYQYKL